MNPTPVELMQKVAEVAPEKYAFFKLATAEIAQGPFAEEVKGELEGIMKKAQGALGNPSMLGQAGRFMGGMAAGVGSAALGGIALALAGDAYGAAKRGLTKSRYYGAMLDANPDLREAPADRVQRAFSTLHRLNPEFSGDPTVAGAYVRKETMSELHQWNPTEMKTLVDSHKGLQDSNRISPFKFDQHGGGGKPGHGGSDHDLSSMKDADDLTAAMMGSGEARAGTRTYPGPGGRGSRTMPYRPGKH